MTAPDPREWLDGLCCPACHGELLLDQGNVTCKAACGTPLLMAGGVPILIDDKRSVFRAEDVARSADQMAAKSLEKATLSLYERVSARVLARLASLLHEREAPTRVLVVGGGRLGPGTRVLYDDPRIRTIATDIYLGPLTRVVCDAHALPFRDASLDAVVIQAVLEHVMDPFACVAEIHRVLKPGGLVFAETPFIQQVHMGAFDFTRFTHSGHRRLFRMFDELESGISAGPGYALAWSMHYFMTSFSEHEPTRRLLSRLAGLLSFPAKRLDRFLMDKRGSLDCASGFHFLGRRRSTPISDAEVARYYRGMN